MQVYYLLIFHRLIALNFGFNFTCSHFRDYPARIDWYKRDDEPGDGIGGREQDDDVRAKKKPVGTVIYFQQSRHTQSPKKFSPDCGATLYKYALTRLYSVMYTSVHIQLCDRLAYELTAVN